MSLRTASDVPRHPRHLVLVLGDQLDAKFAAFDGFDPKLDAVWMAEVAEELTHVWSHQARIALCLAAMRHFRDGLRERGFTVHYRALDDAPSAGALAEELLATASRVTPQKLIVIHPGEWRVERSLHTAARQLGLELEIRPDRHFLSSREEFAAHAKGRKQLRMEFFYREMRRKHDVLMDGDQPVGGRGTSTPTIAKVSASPVRASCRSPSVFDPTRSHAKSWNSWPSVLPSIPAVWRTSIGR